MFCASNIDPRNIEPGELRKLAETVMDGDRLQLVPCGVYDEFSPDTVRMFCHLTARYLLPTTELVHFLKDLLKEPLGQKKVIEIGSGSGDLARFLDIPATDNFCQEWPAVKAMYARTGQPTIVYGDNVVRMDAMDAIKVHQPDVVLGAWVTQWIDPELPPPPGGGNVFGIRESEIIKRVPCYLVVGAEEIHKHKFIMKEPHKTIEAPFVRSRRKDNKIWMWRREP